MLFNSYSFLIFFTTVYFLFRITPSMQGKKYLLLAASYLFYAAWNPPYVLLLIFSTVVDWWLARLIGKTENKSKRRLLLLISLTANLGLLGYFKYGNFVLENFSAWCTIMHIDFHPLQLGIILPIGISFYTFASLSYTVDVYRKEIRSDWRFSDYALFVSFFPHLVAGPIVRASLLLPQIENPKNPTNDEIGHGFLLVCFGLFSKVVMADSIFAPLVDLAYSHPARPSLIESWVAVLSFSGQIFYDFSGYSLCAIGLAMSLGFRFPDNFRHPYGAQSFTDFWRRWHISLSAWLRDYLYIPLGGNRHGRYRTYIALFTTMLIGGLWHGASWMFVLWGGLHGAYLVAEKAFREFRVLPNQVDEIWKTLFIFFMVTITWIPFRASTPTMAINVVQGLFNFSNFGELDLTKLVAIVAMAATIRWHFLMQDIHVEDTLVKCKPWKLVGAGALSLIGLFLCSSGNSNAFIYFQF